MLNGRIKKIEAGFAENNLRFCSCFDAFMSQMIDGIYDEKPYDNDESKLPVGFCQMCGKRVDSERIENLNQQIDLIYGEMFEGFQAERQ
jgi:hypothetical protein